MRNYLNELALESWLKSFHSVCFYFFEIIKKSKFFYADYIFKIALLKFYKLNVVNVNFFQKNVFLVLCADETQKKNSILH